MDRVKRIAKPTPVLIAVGPRDKENHASPDVMFKSKGTGDMKKRKPMLKNNKNMDVINNQINNFEKTRKTVSSEDLITGNPGEAYWEQLSESRRVALDSALKENMHLHTKVMELEYENTKLKAMLSEAKNSIQLLTEVLYDEENESDAEQDDNTADASFTSL